jgi:phytoene dehydrogenase-like protein
MTRTSSYDRGMRSRRHSLSPARTAVVIGAGHNGLVCAAYLALAGILTTLVEARDSVGGCASTVDAIGGRVNICNCDHLWVRGTPIAEELDLASHGLRYLDLDPGYVSLGWNHERPWVLYHDVERTLDGLAVDRPHQVDQYRRYAKATRPLARLIREITNGAPTFGQAARHTIRQRGRGLAALARLSRKSAVDAFGIYFDDEEMARPGLTSGPAVWGVDPTTPGTGLAALGYAAKHEIQLGRPVGGSGAFTDALHKAFTAAGGQTLTSTRVDQVVLEGGRASGVRCEGGDRISADIIVSACDPRRLWVEWLTNPPASATDTVARWKSEPQHEGYESKIDAAIVAPPSYPDLVAAIERDPAVADATVLISPTIQEMSEAHQALARRETAGRPMFITNTPSTLDPSMRTSAGHHVLSLEALWTPFDPDPSASVAAAESWLEAWGTLTDGAVGDIVDRRLMGPADYDREFSMARGHAPSFTGTPLSALRGSPPELTRYRTVIDGLYMSGAVTYPGAGIWGAPGRNAAHTIVKDAGL